MLVKDREQTKFKELERVRKIIYRNKEVIVIDYSDCKGNILIEILEKAKYLILEEKKSCVVLSISNNNAYASPQFIRHLEHIIPEIESLIDKQAIVGISTIQEWIVKGINLWAKRKLYVFDTVDKALDYLTSE